MSTFLDLQNGWYNGFIQGMDQNANSFQIIQPSPPSQVERQLIPSSGLITTTFPHYLLRNSLVASGGNQFYNNYRALMFVLVPSRKVDVEGNIGTANFKAWQTYILGLSTFPTMNQMPTLFRNWAMIFAPNVAKHRFFRLCVDPVGSYCYRSK